MPKTKHNYDVVINIHGGCIDAIWTKKPANILILDWDNINEGDKPTSYTSDSDDERIISKECQESISEAFDNND